MQLFVSSRTQAAPHSIDIRKIGSRSLLRSIWTGSHHQLAHLPWVAATSLHLGFHHRHHPGHHFGQQCGDHFGKGDHQDSTANCGKQHRSHTVASFISCLFHFLLTILPFLFRSSACSIHCGLACQAAHPQTPNRSQHTTPDQMHPKGAAKPQQGFRCRHPQEQRCQRKQRLAHDLGIENSEKD